MTRDELVGAVARAIVRWEREDDLIGRLDVDLAGAVLDVVEPLIRAAERDRIRARTSDALSGLRAQVEAYRDDERAIYDSRRESLDAVLALIDGDTQ